MGEGRERELSAERAVVAHLYDRLDTLRERTRADLRRSQREQTAGTPAALTEQDAFVRLYTDRLAALDAAESRLCFGRLDLSGDGQRYIGRLGLADDDQQPMLTDWRAPAAEPFYQATAADPRGVIRRRHIVTAGRDVTALEDDVLFGLHCRHDVVHATGATCRQCRHEDAAPLHIRSGDSPDTIGQGAEVENVIL